jgi:glycosyltransferase involved in cell wall biosynthesis
MTAVCFVTQIPSPYQVELFNAASKAGLTVSVIYLWSADPSRLWVTPRIDHEHCFLDKDTSAARAWMVNSSLVIFSAYQQLAVRRLLSLRAKQQRPWAFWGERPGVRMSGWLGRQLRALTARNLHDCSAPIWGIGKWAVEGYQKEFGSERLYINVPYYSNLNRFVQLKREFIEGSPCRFLFSGTFTLRKGIDLLASSFSHLMENNVNAELHLIGTGPLEAQTRSRLSHLRDCVHFHGFKQWSELDSVYGQGDVLCAPSRYDGWGLVVPEALASGMSVISTDQTGAALELVTPSHGWIVPAGDGEALLSAMRASYAISVQKRMDMCLSARRAASRQDVSVGVERLARAIDLSLEAWNKAELTQ